MVWDIISHITRYCIFIVKNIINKCFRSCIMMSRDIYIWEEIIGVDTIKKLGSRIMRIVIYEIMLKSPIRYASQVSLEMFSKVGIRIFLNSCIEILKCFYMHPNFIVYIRRYIQEGLSFFRFGWSLFSIIVFEVKASHIKFFVLSHFVWWYCDAGCSDYLIIFK